MKKFAIVLVLVIAVWAVTSSYRAYRLRTEQQLADRRAAIAAREDETHRRALAEQEALRLKELRAQQEAAAAESEIARLRAQQAAADAENTAREAEAARWKAELERLRRDRTAAEAEARRLSAQREGELSGIQRAEQDALDKLHAIDTAKVTSKDREAARTAALAHQEELEKRAREELARLQSQPAR